MRAGSSCPRCRYQLDQAGALKLHRPIYKRTAAYGHFGRDEDEFRSEHAYTADVLRAAAGLSS